MVRADSGVLEENKGWRILVGVFTIDGEFENAAFALNSNLEGANVWYLIEEDIDSQEALTTLRKLIHGFDLITKALWLQGPFHLNDVDPLSKTC